MRSRVESPQGFEKTSREEQRHEGYEAHSRAKKEKYAKSSDANRPSFRFGCHPLCSVRLRLLHGDKNPLKMHRRLTLFFDGRRESDPRFAFLMKHFLEFLQDIGMGTNANSAQLAPNRTLI